MRGNPNAPEITWVPWPSMENLLAYHQVEYEVEEIAPLKIDYVASLNNQARFDEDLNTPRVETALRLAKAIGLALPYPVVHKSRTRSGLYEIDDGNHRFDLAKKAHLTAVTCYVLENPGDETIDLIRRESNSLVGVGQTADEQLAHAVAFAAEHGDKYTIQELVRKFPAVAPNTLQKAVAVQNLRKRMTPGVGDLDVADHSLLKDTALHPLFKLSNHNAVLRVAALGLVRLAKAARHLKVEAKDAQEVVDAAWAVQPRAEEGMIAAAKAAIDRLVVERQAIASQSNRTTTRRTKTRGERVLAEVQRFKKSIEASFPKPAEILNIVTTAAARKQFREYCVEIRRHLAAAEKALGEG